MNLMKTKYSYNADINIISIVKGTIKITYKWKKDFD